MAKKRMKNYHVLISLKENPQIRNIRDFYLRQVQWAVLNFFYMNVGTDVRTRIYTFAVCFQSAW